MAGEHAALVLLTAVSAVGLPGPGDSALIAAVLLAAGTIKRNWVQITR